MRPRFEFLGDYLSSSMTSPIERMMARDEGQPEEYTPLGSIPALDLFLGEKRYNSHTIPVRMLLSHALGSGGRDDYKFVDDMFGIAYPDLHSTQFGSGLSAIFKKLIIDQEADMTIGGSIVADCIGTTHEHMIRNSQFLAAMQWVFGREIKPELFKNNPEELCPNNPKVVSNHLIRLYYAGGLDVDAMTDEGHTLFRYLQKLAGANSDVRIVSSKIKELRIIRDLIAATISILHPYHEASVSTVSNGKTNLIHIDNPYGLGKEINIIVSDKQDDAYSNITTWRQAATAPIYYREDRSLVVDIDPEKFRQQNKMLYTPSNYWAWLTYVYKNARSVLVAGVPPVVLDQRSFLENRPEFDPDPSYEQVINASANAIHADAINPNGLYDIVEKLDIKERIGLNEYDEVYAFIMDGLHEIFVGEPHGYIMPFIEDLARSMTRYLPVRLPRLIERTPPPRSRDMVEARILGVDLSKRRGKTEASFAVQTIDKLLSEPVASALSIDELAAIDMDKRRLSLVD